MIRGVFFTNQNNTKRFLRYARVRFKTKAIHYEILLISFRGILKSYIHVLTEYHIHERNMAVDCRLLQDDLFLSDSEEEENTSNKTKRIFRCIITIYHSSEFNFYAHCRDQPKVYMKNLMCDEFMKTPVITNNS